jgi:ABC-type glutathione transport system ATPase component
MQVSAAQHECLESLRMQGTGARRWLEVRVPGGNRISIIHQDPNALISAISVGDAIAGVIRAQCKWIQRKVRQEAEARLTAVGLADCKRSFRRCRVVACKTLNQPCSTPRHLESRRNNFLRRLSVTPA